MRAETAAMIMMSGSADLEDITITENGEYESVDHDGFDVVTVEVETYWDEYQQALQQISDLEDALEDCHDCRDAVVAAIQVYDPTYDPASDECPADEIPALVQAVQPTLGSKFITANGTYLPASDNLDGYNQVVVDVPTWESCIQTIANKLGVQSPYDCEDITDALDEQIGTYKFPVGTPYQPITELVGADELTDTTVGITIGIYETVDTTTHQGSCTPYYLVSGDSEKHWLNGVGAGYLDHFENATVKIIDPTTGEYDGGVDAYWTYTTTPTHFTFNGTNSNLIGYGSSSHEYQVKNS